MRRRYNPILCTGYNRGAISVLVWSGLVFSILLIVHVQYNPIMQYLFSSNSVIMDDISGPRNLLFLLYPVYGLIGERYTRYKVMFVGTVSLTIGYCVNIAMIPVMGLLQQRLTVILVSILTYLLYLIGMGLFQANVIQLGLDQLISAPSDKLRSYIYWFVSLMYLPSSVILAALSAVTDLHSVTLNKQVFKALVLVIFFAPVIPLLVSLLTACCCKKHINIEPPFSELPAKLIYKVMKYAWKHKYPVRRSAFTYAERPSRLDLGKNRYGGPFTTEEVEDVKSFWQVLMVLLSLFGVFMMDNFSGIAKQYVTYYGILNDTSVTVSPGESIILVYPTTIIYSSMFLSIIVMQLVMFPFLSTSYPSLFKRMGTGLFITLCVASAHTFFSAYLYLDKPLPYGYLAILQVSYGIGFSLCFITAFEFIVAQAPGRMQGMLIGIWFSQLSLKYICVTLTLSSLGQHWWFYATRSGLVLVSVVCYIVAAKRYRYRKRNEISDVNERLVIAEYCERQILRRDSPETKL